MSVLRLPVRILILTPILLVTLCRCSPDYFSARKVAERLETAAIRKAAEKGKADAQFELGVRLSNGRGAREDLEEAAVWCRKAADQGHVRAQYCLGRCYAFGYGVPKDISQAIAWFRKAAEQGEIDAQGSLGFIYVDCESVYLDCGGVEKDIGEAIKWFRMAADQGDGFGMYCLGAIYDRGIDVSKDAVAAYQWYDLADKHGWRSAEFRDKLAKEMTPEGLAEAKQRVVAFEAGIEAATE